MTEGKRPPGAPPLRREAAKKKSQRAHLWICGQRKGVDHNPTGAASARFRHMISDEAGRSDGLSTAWCRAARHVGCSVVTSSRALVSRVLSLASRCFCRVAADRRR